MSWDVLARLWLREPDAKALESAAALGLASSDATPDELASGFSELFLLNVYPYGSVFTDASGELNGRFASWSASRYERGRYLTAELWDAGAPDHVGLCLGFLGHAEKSGQVDREFLLSLQEWLPVCALAVERDPSAAGLYRSLAAATRARILSAGNGGHPDAPPAEDERFEEVSGEQEVRLSNVLSHLLAPARSGFFLSRSRLGHIARRCGLQLPFGGRYDVARALFAAAGESQRVKEVLGALSAEAKAWDAAYAAWERDGAAWSGFASVWRSRIRRTRRRLAKMEDLLRRPLDVEYGEEAGR
jgi:TorA maturation chaperone TorD